MRETLTAALSKVRPELTAEQKRQIVDEALSRLWQPIESAPRDGTAVLVVSWDRQLIACWDPGACGARGAWTEVNGGFTLEASHWMPVLPGPTVL